MRFHRSSAAFLAAATLLAAFAGCARKEAEPKKQTPEAGYVVLKTETVPLTNVLAGRTAPFETAEVRPQVGGIVKARLFTEGSKVRAGQALYQIDPSLYRAAQAQAQANLASAQAAQKSAQALAGRYKPLAAMEAISKQDYTNAVAGAGQANAAVAQQKAALKTAQINLGYARITAPISGRIGRSSVTAGALVSPNQADALATIQRLDPIFVDIQQSSADLLALRRALARGGTLPSTADVWLTLEDGTRYPQIGRLEFAEVTVDPATGSVALRARFPNPDGVLLPGMYVRASVSQGQVPNAILAPQTGISRSPQGDATALVVGDGGKAEERKVKLGRTVGDKWLVLSGLKAGDKLIVEGLGNIKADQAIVAVPAGSKPRPRGGDAKDKSGGAKSGGE